MGLLKVVLPVVGLLHLYAAFLAFTEPAKVLDLLSISHEVSLSASTVYLVHVLSGAFASLGVLSVLSYIMGSVSRFKVGVANLIFHALPAVDAHFFTKGATTALQTPLVACAGVLTVSLVLHLLEPGLFTQDKRKRKST
ncbi:hypothetical protein JKP88DRAFT_70546 [Tribonema minus]|uniref:Uncharacterized protein n=1 Tax=Tribonema minus TaxID=303371 RepID=A0A836CDN8_9STRA|nr:hypothetical protein JKP88DRAFT_70546 [Tribonema minus]